MPDHAHNTGSLCENYFVLVAPSFSVAEQRDKLHTWSVHYQTLLGVIPGEVRGPTERHSLIFFRSETLCFSGTALHLPCSVPIFRLGVNVTRWVGLVRLWNRFRWRLPHARKSRSLLSARCVSVVLSVACVLGVRMRASSPLCSAACELDHLLFT